MKEIRVKVIPDSRKETITEAADGRLIVALRAPRKEGKANERLCALLVTHFSVPLEQVHIVRGLQQSSKTVRIH